MVSEQDIRYNLHINQSIEAKNLMKAKIFGISEYLF